MGKVQLFLHHTTVSPESSSKVCDTEAPNYVPYSDATIAASIFSMYLLLLVSLCNDSIVLDLEVCGLFDVASASSVHLNEDLTNVLAYVVVTVGSCWRNQSIRHSARCGHASTKIPTT